MTIQELLNTKLDGVKRPHKGSVKIDETGTGKDDPRYDLSMTIDYSGWTVEQVLDSLASPALWITRCRVLRTMTAAEVKATDKVTILATNMGRKPSSVPDPKAAYAARFQGLSKEEQLKEIAELQALAKHA